ncbi:type I restriction enzyme HsdR N-terminal domain-containing protein [Hymenobacter gummosus]|uniref:Type I restriction enzyme HsdR N-terminal domain-containing protein n=1 Tax=Hymenobacter gummosus TaxID=1776032 RepID=A0A431TVN7_9BACT|nr:type I restriction enzyme HsdR N-terminal domain-containing protein [Hymenobacter gummosus]RTQ45310.1 type I restriction enzyme HsdR N-terminal domain-containing protein [Hymenobacter gummosus]
MAFRKNGKDCLLCVSRRKLIIVTPEEKVRQQFVLDLVEKFRVPLDMIEVEVPLSHYEKGLKGRVDIVVSVENRSDNMFHPLLIVECKESNVALTDIVFEQARRYDMALEPKVTVVTNGIETVAFQWDDKLEDYVEIEYVPLYEDLITKDYFHPKEASKVEWERPNHLKANKKIYNELLESAIIGEDSTQELYPFLLNMIGLFYDVKDKIPSLNLKNASFDEDCLVRFTTFGNASGG